MLPSIDAQPDTIKYKYELDDVSYEVEFKRPTLTTLSEVINATNQTMDYYEQANTKDMPLHSGQIVNIDTSLLRICVFMEMFSIDLDHRWWYGLAHNNPKHFIKLATYLTAQTNELMETLNFII